MEEKYKIQRTTYIFLKLIFYLETGFESDSELELLRGVSGFLSSDFDFSFTVSFSDLDGDLSKLELDDRLSLETDLEVDLLLILDELDFCDNIELDLTVLLEICEDLDDTELSDLRLGLELGDRLFSLDLSLFCSVPAFSASSSEFSFIRSNNISTNLS